VVLYIFVPPARKSEICKMIPRIKICCISSIEEAMTAIEYGASAIGLVGRMPSGPGPISDALIRQIASEIPPPVATFLLTCETSVKKIIEHHKRTLTNTIQIVDMLSQGTCFQLKDELPSVKIVQVIHVIDARSVDTAIRISEQADALLLDSGNPNLKVKKLGGTGRIHNWKLSRQIRDHSKCPVFLAGGLKPENVQQAIKEVEPFGIDVCSGIRTDGKLDRQKLSDFFINALKQ
jgi:phosphoribosylanthranilate isomerase